MNKINGLRYTFGIAVGISMLVLLLARSTASCTKDNNNKDTAHFFSGK